MRAIIMLCLGLWAALLLNPGEVYANADYPDRLLSVSTGALPMVSLFGILMEHTGSGASWN